MDEGLCYFKSMGPVYSIPATIEPYACLVDPVGCAGHLHMVEDVVKTMSCELYIFVWVALLGAYSRVHGKWRWEEVLPNEFLNQTLGMQQVMWSFQTFKDRGCGWV
jgi:hypothetical protein